MEINASSLSDLVVLLVEPMLDHPEDLAVTSKEDEDRITIEISVYTEDAGRVIGRSGRIIKAIRTLVRACANQAGLHVDVELVD